MMLEITAARVENGTIENGYIQFNIDDEDGPYTVNQIYLDDDGDVCLESNEEGEDEYDVDQIVTEVSAFDEDTYVYFKVVDEDGNEECYDISDEWEVDDDGDTMVELYDDDDDDEEGDDGYDDETNGEMNDSMTVERLRFILSMFDTDRHLYVSDNDEISDCTVDAIFPRNGEAVLQSNELDPSGVLHRHSITLSYIDHCLKWFDDEDHVCFMHCDEDNDCAFYDIVDYRRDEDDNLELVISMREAYFAP